MQININIYALILSGYHKKTVFYNSVGRCMNQYSVCDAILLIP